MKILEMYRYFKYDSFSSVVDTSIEEFKEYGINMEADTPSDKVDCFDFLLVLPKNMYCNKNELLSFVSGSNILAADYVKKIVKLIRAYNGGTCISTQDVSDFFALNNGEYGEAILANSQIKVILGMDDMHDISYFKDAVGLTFDEIKAIRKYKKGQCLVCANSSHIPIQVVASSYEDKLITTDPTQVKGIEMEIKKYGKVLR